MPAANLEHVDFVRSVPLFADLSPRLLKRLTASATEVHHARGHVVVKQGAGVHLLHIIMSGEAAVTVDGKPVAHLGPGDYFGEIALVTGGKRTATVTATTDLRVLGIEPAAFRRLLRADTELAAALPAAITDRLRELDERRTV